MTANDVKLKLAFSVFWSLAMGLSAFVSLVMLGWQMNAHMVPVVVLFLLAGLPGGYIGWLIADYLTKTKGADQKFAALVVSLVFFTAMIAAILFALQYRQYYSEFHSSAFTIGWVFQFLFTGFAAFYLFAVQGARLFLPVGVPALLCAGFIYARWSR